MKRFLMMAVSVLLAAIMPFVAAFLFVGVLVGVYLINPMVGNVLYAAVAMGALAFTVYHLARFFFDLLSCHFEKSNSKAEVSKHENQ